MKSWPSRLAVQVGRRTGQDRSSHKDDADAADDGRQDGLQAGSRLGTDDVDSRNGDSDDDGRSQPGRIDVEAADGVQVTHEEIREQVDEDRRQGAGFKTDDADIAEDDHPRADEGTDRPHGLITENVFAAALRHSRCQFGISKADKENHDAADGEPQHGAEDTAAGDPIPCRYDPGPANHCPEGDDQDVPGIEYFVKTRLFRCHMALPLYNTDDFTK